MYGRLTELSLRLEHQHGDGSWASFERTPHDSSEHDPEREWMKGQIYTCTRCDEKIRISLPDVEPVPGSGMPD